MLTLTLLAQTQAPCNTAISWLNCIAKLNAKIIILLFCFLCIVRDLRNLHLQNRMQNRKISDLLQNLRPPAKCRKILRFKQIPQNLRFLCEICDIFTKFPVFAQFLSRNIKISHSYRNKLHVNNLITCDRFVYCSGFVTYFIICQQKLHYIIIMLHKMIKLQQF